MAPRAGRSPATPPVAPRTVAARLTVAAPRTVAARPRVAVARPRRWGHDLGWGHDVRWWRRQVRARRRRQGRVVRRVQEPDRRHRRQDHHRQRLRHLRSGPRPLRVGPARHQGVRRLLQRLGRDICGRKLELQLLRQPDRRRRRPAGLHPGLRRGLRDDRLDVGLRLRRRRHRREVWPARHALGRRDRRPGQAARPASAPSPPTRSSRTPFPTSSSRTTATRASTRRCSTSTPAPPRRTASRRRPR